MLPRQAQVVLVGGANVVVPPADTENVSESNTPRTVALPVPLLLAWQGTAAGRLRR